MNFLDKAFNQNDEGYCQIRDKYYYYNMRLGHTMIYNGDIRGKNGEQIPFRSFLNAMN